jgi:hypothetical protein
VLDAQLNPLDYAPKSRRGRWRNPGFATSAQFNKWWKTKESFSAEFLGRPLPELDENGTSTDGERKFK